MRSSGLFVRIRRQCSCGKAVIGERLLDRRFGEVGGYCQRDARNFSITRTAFSRAAAISSLAWIALSIAAISAPWLKGRD
jgi:hypothetical protein